MELLPIFPYHPDPVATGSVVRSDEQCMCCERSRGYVYASSIYGRAPLAGFLCPWCIASGEAHRQFGVEFADPPDGVPVPVGEEIAFRTPSYDSFQQEQWRICCQDACEYHGEAPRDEIRCLGNQDFGRMAEGTGYSIEHLASFAKSYDPGGDPCIHKFVCRHCRRVHYAVDGT